MSLGFKYMLIAVLMYTVMNVSIKFLSHIPTVEVVFFRALFTLVLSYAYLKRAKINPLGVNKKVLILRGVFGTIGLTCYFYTIQVLPFGTAVTIQNLSPIFTIIIASFWLKESTKPVQWLFFLMAFVGILLIKGFDTSISTLDIAIGVVAAVASGCAYNVVRTLRKTDHPLVVVFYFPLVTFPIFLPLTIVQWQMPSPQDWFFICLMGVFTQLAQVYLTKAYQAAKAEQISIAHYLQIIIAVVIGSLAFNEAPDWLSMTGIAIILLSIFLNTYYSNKSATSHH